MSRLADERDTKDSVTSPVLPPKLSFQEYSTLVEQAPFLIWRADLSMGCDYFNEKWLAFTGRTYAQEYGNGWAEGVHPEDLSRCLQIYTTAFAARQTFEMEYRLRRFDGEYRWLFDRGVPFTAPDGKFAGFIGSCVDVTERVEAQAKDSELHLLRGLVPICAWCKKVRDDQGYWDQVEHYLGTRSELRFSHGMCPACYENQMRSIEAASDAEGRATSPPQWENPKPQCTGATGPERKLERPGPGWGSTNPMQQ